MLERDPLEHELLAAMPDAAALVSKEGWVRVSNAAFDTLAVDGRSLGLTPLEITRSAELSEAVKRALEGTSRKLELTIGHSIYRAHLAPLLRGEVLLLLRDVTEPKRAEATRRDFVAEREPRAQDPHRVDPGGGRDPRPRGRARRPRRGAGFVEIVERNAVRLSRLVDGPARPLADREPASGRFDMAAVDATALAAQVVALLSAAAADKRLRLRSELPEGVTVRADPRSLEQVLVNLVDNAVKYTAKGEVVLRAERDGSTWVLSVVDTGAGDRAPPPAADLRALLPRRRGALARAGRHGARPRHREAPRPGDERRRRGGERPRGEPLLGAARGRLTASPPGAWTARGRHGIVTIAPRARHRPAAGFARQATRRIRREVTHEQAPRRDRSPGARRRRDRVRLPPHQRRGRDVPGSRSTRSGSPSTTSCTPSIALQLPVDRLRRRHPADHRGHRRLRRLRRADERRASWRRLPDVVHVPTVLGAVVVTYNAPVQGLKLTPEVARRHLPRQDHEVERPRARRASTRARSCPTSPSRSRTAPTGRARPTSSPTTSPRSRPEWKEKVGAGKSVKWPVGLGGKGNEGVTGLVKATPGAIGYVELAYANQNKLAARGAPEQGRQLREAVARRRPPRPPPASTMPAGLPRLDHRTPTARTPSPSPPSPTSSSTRTRRTRRRARRS